MNKEELLEWIEKKLEECPVDALPGYWTVYYGRYREALEDIKEKLNE